MELYGLIGFPLTHSFSKKFFTEKFEMEGTAHQFKYELFEMQDPSGFPRLFKENPRLKGVNVTIPHKQSVFSFLDDLDQSAERVGAVNVVKKLDNGKLIGFNSDLYGFIRSLTESLGQKEIKGLKALVLGGNGGAAKAVLVALEDLGIEARSVSREAMGQSIDYRTSANYLPSHRLIINCTPLGTYPNVETCPDLAYPQLNINHFLFDLVYNPTETLFMKKGLEQGCTVKNGYDMLVYQAEKSWEIWREGA